MKFRGIMHTIEGVMRLNNPPHSNPKQLASGGDRMEAGTIGDTQEVVLGFGLEAESDSFHQKEFKHSLPPHQNPVLFAEQMQ